MGLADIFLEAAERRFKTAFDEKPRLIWLLRGPIGPILIAVALWILTTQEQNWNRDGAEWACKGLGCLLLIGLGLWFLAISVVEFFAWFFYGLKDVTCESVRSRLKSWFSLRSSDRTGPDAGGSRE